MTKSNETARNEALAIGAQILNLKTLEIGRIDDPDVTLNLNAIKQALIAAYEMGRNSK